MRAEETQDWVLLCPRAGAAAATLLLLLLWCGVGYLGCCCSPPRLGHSDIRGAWLFCFSVSVGYLGYRRDDYHDRYVQAAGLLVLYAWYVLRPAGAAVRSITRTTQAVRIFPWNWWNEQLTSRNHSSSSRRHKSCWKSNGTLCSAS